MWSPTKTAKYGVAIYNFDGKVKMGLPLNIGDTVHIIEEYTDWYYGYLYSSKSQRGIFPVRYISIKPCNVDIEGPNETVTPVEDPVVKEVAYVLREWGRIWKRLYVEQKAHKFTFIHNVMLDLIESRKSLVSGTLTTEQSAELKSQIISKIDWGNKQLDLDLVPRIETEQVDVERISAVELFRIHESSVENAKFVTHRGSLRPRKHSQAVVNHHLLVDFRNFGYKVGETAEVHMALYDAKAGKYFTDRFLTVLTVHGQPVNENKVNDNKAIFTDLGNKDLQRDAYLVAHIYRLGSMKEPDNKKGPPTTQYKRPHGCAVVSVKDILMGNWTAEDDADYKDEQMKIYSCSESEFPQLHENIIKKLSTKYSLNNGHGIRVSLKMCHGELEQVQKEEPISFRHIAIARKLGFSDVIMPGDVRNDLYVTLNRGDFEKGSKKAARNVEIRVMVLGKLGYCIPNCISPGAGEEPVTTFNSHIFYHSNTPKWNDTIKLTIPIEDFFGSHLRFEFRHCSTRDKARKNMFAFAFVPLIADNGTTIKDGPHELYLYKCEDANKLKSIDSYLPSLPCSSADHNPELGTSQGNTLYQRSDGRFVYIDTLLCSTKLTQNTALLGLFKWRTNPELLDWHLDQLLQLEGEEIVKYLQDILNNLFSMFTLENGKRILQAHSVFKALVYIFGLLESTRFEHFKPVFDAYIANHFSAILVGKDLLLCLKETLEFVSQTDNHDHLKRCFQVLPYIGKCIVQTRLLYTRAYGTDDSSEYRELLQQVFDAIVDVMAIQNTSITQAQNKILHTQVTLLANVPALYAELSKICPSHVVSKAFCRLINNMPRESMPADLVVTRLQCLYDIINSGLFKCPDSKAILLPVCMAALKRHFVNRSHLKLAVKVLGDILKILHDDQQQGIPSFENIDVMLTALLDVIIQTTLTIDRKSAVMGALVGCLTAMLKMMEEKHYHSALEGYSDRKPLKEFLTRTITLFRDLVNKDVFPKDWMVMKMTVNSVILDTLQFIAQTLTSYFREDMLFDQHLWSSYFCLAVCFLTQPCLQMEQFSDAKKQKVHERYGDMRVRMGYEIVSMWQNLGPKKLQFIPSMVGPFLQVTLVPEEELRQAVLPIFFDMMQCEQHSYGNFKQVESELIDKLDILVSENKGDKQYSQLFNTILLRKVEMEPSWKESGAAFIHSVTMLLERLMDYRNVIDGDENREKRMACTVNLLNFYKNEINRQEMYIRYIYKLSHLHLEAQNYAEAGFTLLLHTELLEWSEDEVPEHDQYPAMLEWIKKEQLYTQIVEYFDLGKSWEYGIPLLKELVDLYERKIKYRKLSETLALQASSYTKILNELRPEPEYFKVGFYGESLPLFLRNKEFIFRGLEYEKLSGFTHRVTSEFPGATLLNQTTVPTENLKNGDNQCIQIYKVTPLPDIDPAFMSESVPENVRSFYQVNQVDCFVMDRPVHRGEKDKANEFKTLWLERTTLKTSNKFPGILRWFEIVTTESQMLSPIETAIDMVEMKNRELRALVAKYSHGDRKNIAINPLTMTLNGVVDAAVNGGIDKYKEAFFTEEFKRNNPEHEPHVKTLKACIVDQIHILEGALSLHGRIAPETLQPLHKKLVELFTTIKEGLKDSSSPSMIRLIGSSDQLNNMPNHRRDSSYSNHSTQSSISSLSSSSNKSPRVGATPPGSNRSSGIFNESQERLVGVDSESQDNVANATVERRRNTTWYVDEDLTSAQNNTSTSNAQPRSDSDDPTSVAGNMAGFGILTTNPAKMAAGANTTNNNTASTRPQTAYKPSRHSKTSTFYTSMPVLSSSSAHDASPTVEISSPKLSTKPEPAAKPVTPRVTSPRMGHRIVSGFHKFTDKFSRKEGEDETDQIEESPPKVRRFFPKSQSHEAKSGGMSPDEDKTQYAESKPHSVAAGNTQRPLSAKYDLSPKPYSLPKHSTPGSDPALNRRTTEITGSSISLDSGLGKPITNHKRAMSSPFGSHSGNTPPKVPPRKPSFSGSESDAQSPQAAGKRFQPKARKQLSEPIEDNSRGEYHDLPSNVPNPNVRKTYHHHGKPTIEALNTRVPPLPSSGIPDENPPQLPPKRSMSVQDPRQSARVSVLPGRSNSAGISRGPAVPPRNVQHGANVAAAAIAAGSPRRPPDPPPCAEHPTESES